MEDISLHILDVAENGIKAGADLVKITVEENTQTDRLVVTIEDNGRGMDADFLARVLDPFVTTRTTRKVGLGLSLFQQSAQEAGGDLTIASTPGVGTTVTAFMSYRHIDRKPMGNMVETMLTLIEGNPDCDFVYTHISNDKRYVLDTREIRCELEEIPMNHPEVTGLIRDNLVSGLQGFSAE
ncbi:MAG: ATP-binding protein [Desulfomonile tiedjei]|nr:ATP-binding protein [Desulfomonile tiedjei]